MKITLLLLAFATLAGLLSARDIPQSGNPSLEYEIVNRTQAQPIKPQTDDDGKFYDKAYVYVFKTKEWIEVKPSDGKPKEGDLVWNQKNDKWLTQSSRP